MLGDLRAEADHRMLELAFLETPDFRSLLEGQDNRTVVGRRGTGKSALMYQLSKHWQDEKRQVLIRIAAEEDQVIGIRPLLARYFGGSFKLVRAGFKIAWRYALVMELLDGLSRHYKARQIIEAQPLATGRLRIWRAAGPDILTRLRVTLRQQVPADGGAESTIGELRSVLYLREMEDLLDPAITAGNLRCRIMIDRLDDGYEFDEVGIGLVNGVMYGTSELAQIHANLATIIFLRDNIFRAISAQDPDFSRNIEGQTLRLHWDSYQLFNFICKRLRTAFRIETENNQRTWNKCVAYDLQGMDGFQKCLQLTLYRPRDILLLLNQSFYHAEKSGKAQIGLEDIESSAKSISESRLQDLHKEYEAILPGLSVLTRAFASGNPELTLDEARERVRAAISRDDFEPIVQQDMALYSSPDENLKNLFGVGFFGIHNAVSSSYVFSHDGKQPTRELEPKDRILVHPCYWLALNLNRNSLNPDQAEEIHDEYEIETTSQTPVIRSQKIGELIAELEKIPLGQDGATRFEEWSQNAIQVAFAGKLRNVELHPNRNAVQRRDVVATNLSADGAWRRILDDYKSRQVIFEIKNLTSLTLEHYRQMQSYLCDDYGALGFIVTRDNSENLVRGGDLDYFLEMYHKHKIVIVKLTGKYLCTLLSKLRKPLRHDEPDNRINKLLDVYSRQYLSGVAAKGEQSVSEVPRRGRRRNKRPKTSSL